MLCTTYFSFTLMLLLSEGLFQSDETYENCFSLLGATEQFISNGGEEIDLLLVGINVQNSGTYFNFAVCESNGFGLAQSTPSEFFHSKSCGIKNGQLHYETSIIPNFWDSTCPADYLAY